MEKLGFGLHDNSASIDQKQTNPRESRLLGLQRCIKYLIHAVQCTDANCRVPSCQKMKRVVKHAMSCKQKRGGGCPVCKQLVALCCYHAKHCQEAECCVPFCVNIKTKLRHQQRQQRLQQGMQRPTQARQQLLQTLKSPPSAQEQVEVLRILISNLQLTAAQQQQLTAGPPVGALQAVQQVQAAAARQTEPHMAAASVNSDKGNPIVSPPTANAGLMPTTQQMQKPMSQMMSGVPNVSNVACLLGRLRICSELQPHNNPQPQPAPQMGLQQQTQLMGGPGNMPNSIGNSSMGPPQVMPNPGPSLGGMQRPTQAWQQLLETLKSPPSAQQQVEVLAILKSNPQLMAAFIKQRNAQQQQLK